MSSSETFQIPIEVAEVYEARFVPAIFAEWAPRILDAAEVGPGASVLDVGCGTGIVARTAAERVGAHGRVVGVDLNEAMLTVARRIAPHVDWRRGDAADLPVGDDVFDAVTCQMAMMFFPERTAALAEFARVTAPDGRVAVVVPASLDDQPGYREFVDAAVGRVGADARSLLGTYWNCGDTSALAADADRAGLSVIDVVTIEGTARFASPADFVATEIGGSPLAEQVSADTAALITADVADRLRHLGGDDGFDVPLVCRVVSAGRRSP